MTSRPIALVTGIAVALLVVACGGDRPSKLVGWPDALPGWDHADTAHVDAAPPADTAPVAVPSGACRTIVDKACALWGEFTDSCAEARSTPPDDNDPETAAACQALLDEFESEIAPNRHNPCRRYARGLCREQGKTTRACQLALANIPMMRRSEQKDACLADLLMWHARGFRR